MAFIYPPFKKTGDVVGLQNPFYRFTINAQSGHPCTGLINSMVLVLNFTKLQYLWNVGQTKEVPVPWCTPVSTKFQIYQSNREFWSSDNKLTRNNTCNCKSRRVVLKNWFCYFFQRLHTAVLEYIPSIFTNTNYIKKKRGTCILIIHHKNLNLDTRVLRQAYLASQTQKCT